MSDFDILLNYGKGDIQEETRSDIQALLLQPKRSLFYSRDRGAAGLDDYENTPIGIAQQVQLPYDIVSAIAERNLYVSAGENGKDRRVATSQNQVFVSTDQKSGSLSVQVNFLALSDLENIQTIRV
jgi:hypothetical protein